MNDICNIENYCPLLIIQNYSSSSCIMTLLCPARRISAFPPPPTYNVNLATINISGSLVPFSAQKH